MDRHADGLHLGGFGFGGLAKRPIGSARHTVSLDQIGGLGNQGLGLGEGFGRIRGR